MFRLVFSFALLGSTPTLLAEAGRASLRGQVLDQTGAAVSGAVVHVWQDGLAFHRNIAADAEGRFLFDRLPPGAYRLSARSDGFATLSEDAVLEAGEDRILKVVLRLRDIAEQVTVSATSLVAGPDVLPHIPGSVDVLDRTTLTNSRVFTSSEALRKTAGLNVRDEEGMGLRPNIGIRGLNPTRSSKILLLEDGIPLTYAPYGDNASYYHPPIDRFERVEIMKGSGQILYGPVTVGGVINYVTPPAPVKPSGSATLLGGSRDYLNGHVAYGGTWGRTGLLFDYLRKQGEGARENTRSGLNDFNFKSITSVSARQVVTLKYNYYSEDSNVTYSGLREDEYRANPRQNPFRNDFFYGDRWGGALTHSFMFSTNLALTTSVYAASFDRDWWRQSSNSSQRPNDAADPACRGMENLNTTCGNEGRLRQYSTVGVEPRLRASHRLFGLRNDTDVGVRFHYEIQNRLQQNGILPTSRSGALVEDNERRNEAYSAFVQNRFVIGNWTVTPGVRIERIGYERANRLTRVGGRTDLTQIVPGLGVAYSPAGHTSLFAGVHRGFAPPRTEDIINNATGGSIDLDPERSWNYEAGVRTLPRNGIRLEATYFRMDYENQIVPASLAGGVGATLTNGGATLHEGAELTARVDTGILFGLRHNLYARVASTYLPTAEFKGTRYSSVSGFGSVLITGNRLPYAPERLLNLGLGYSSPRGLDVVLEAVRTSDQFGDDLNTVVPSPDGQRGLVPGQTIWNATANYHVESLQTTFFVAVKNMLDEIFIVDRSRGILPSGPRLFHAGVRFRF